MKKKLLVIVSLLFLVISFTKVNADTSSRDIKEEKTKVTVQGVDLYGGVEVEFNNKTRKGFIGKFELSYDEKANTFTAKVKRSQINNLVQSDDKNAYINIELNLDFHDFEEGQNYYTTYTIDNDTKYCHTDKINAGGTNNAGSSKYLEMLSTAVEITGGTTYTSTSTGKRALYKGNAFTNPSGCLPLSDLESDTRMIYLEEPHYRFSIDEDVAADMGNMESIDTSHEANNNSHENDIKINNFYEIVDANRKQQLALSMFDENGNPIEISQDDLNVEIDESQNAEEIASSFEGDRAEDVQILSINYKKNFKGKAKIKTYVGKKFKGISNFNVYYFNETTKKMEIVTSNAKVDKDGYVGFTVNHFSEYVVTSSDNKVKEEKEDTDAVPVPQDEETNTTVDDTTTVGEITESKDEEKKDNGLWQYLLGVGIALFIILIIAVIAIVRGKKKETPVQPVTETIPEGATEAVEEVKPVEGNDLMAPPPPVEETPTEENHTNE